MGGKLEIWGKSQKQHDDLVKSLPAMARRSITALSAISEAFKQIHETCEDLGRYEAGLLGIQYPEPDSAQPLAFVGLDLIVQSLRGPRHEMNADEVARFRSAIRSIVKLSGRTAGEIGKLSKAISDANRCLTRVERFYSMPRKRGWGTAKAKK